MSLVLPTEIAAPVRLEDLFAVFDSIEAGAVVALWPKRFAGVRLPPPPPGPHIGVCSSGTTGLPKLVWRDWEGSKAEAVCRPEMKGWTWASPYAAWSFAGFQVALQAWATGGNAVSLGTDLSLVSDQLGQAHALCCTPTYADLVLQHGKFKMPDPRRITLGGEPLRPPVGQRLQAAFPNAQFTVVYAAAELGILLKTHRMDGWYETASLEKRFPQWRIQDETLRVFMNGWRNTSDRVEVRGNLMRVNGRIGSVAIVGGTKVDLNRVERFAEQVHGVRRAVAWAEANSVTGQVVCLRVETEIDQEREAVLARLESDLRRKLAKEAWPRRWLIGKISVRTNGKRAG
jgi:acyl-CoA synthetase (AMP-forming)/AMP-acid ligase II